MTELMFQDTLYIYPGSPIIGKKIKELAEKYKIRILGYYNSTYLPSHWHIPDGNTEIKSGMNIEVEGDSEAVKSFTDDALNL